MSKPFPVTKILLLISLPLRGEGTAERGGEGLSVSKSEFALIAKINETVRQPTGEVVRAIGEDCAVFVKNAQDHTVISTDCLIENIHFDLKYFSFLELGKKAMAVNLSDIAAMGAEPKYALVSLGISPHMSEVDVLNFYAGLEQCLQMHGGHIVGGDLSKSSGAFFINITVVGECHKEQCKMRSTAQVGDGIYVSGHLGTAALGLVALQKRHDIDAPFVQALKTPHPQIKLGRSLAKHATVHAMMDVSDGLLQDLGHILTESKVSAQVCVDEIPVLPNFEAACLTLKQNPLELRLSGGEDYQLLVTIDEAAAENILTELKTFGMGLARIGTIVESKATQPECLVYRQNGDVYHPKHLGFDHFA